MRKQITWISLIGALLLAGCNGPKSDCAGSFKSYQNMLESQDWEGLYELLTPEHKKKFSMKNYLAGMTEVWGPTHSFDWRLNLLTETGKVCIVNGMMEYTFKIRGKEPEDRDEYFSFTFRQQADGKWHIEQPGAEKISGW